MLAKEIMHTHVFQVTPKMTLRQVARLFAKHGISGAPVVAPGGGLIGMISQSDIISQSEKFVSSRRACVETRVEHAMTPWGVSFEENTPVIDLARQILAKRIHRVVITRDGEMCGIVTTLDVLRALLKILEKKH